MTENSVENLLPCDDHADHEVPPALRSLLIQGRAMLEARRLTDEEERLRRDREIEEARQAHYQSLLACVRERLPAVADYCSRMPGQEFTSASRDVAVWFTVPGLASFAAVFTCRGPGKAANGKKAVLTVKSR